MKTHFYMLNQSQIQHSYQEGLIQKDSAWQNHNISFLVMRFYETHVSIRSTVVQQATHIRVYTGLSPTSVEHRQELISALSFSLNDENK